MALSATPPPEPAPLVFEVWVRGLRPVDGWPVLEPWVAVVVGVGVVGVVGVVGTAPVLPVGIGVSVPVVGVPVVGVVTVVGTVAVGVVTVPVLPGVVTEGGLAVAAGSPTGRLSGSITSEMGSGRWGASPLAGLLAAVAPEIVAPTR